MLRILLSLVLVSFLGTATADVSISNNTNNFLTMRMSSVTNECTAGMLDGYTLPQLDGLIKTPNLWIMCGLKSPCTMTLIMAKDERAMKKCEGKVIATMQIDHLETELISSIGIVDYSFMVMGLSTKHLSINKIG